MRVHALLRYYDVMMRAKRLMEYRDRLMSTESNIAGQNSRLLSALYRILSATRESCGRIGSIKKRRQHVVYLFFRFQPLLPSRSLWRKQLGASQNAIVCSDPSRVFRPNGIPPQFQNAMPLRDYERDFIVEQFILYSTRPSEGGLSWVCPRDPAVGVFYRDIN